MAALFFARHGRTRTPPPTIVSPQPRWENPCALPPPLSLLWFVLRASPFVPFLAPAVRSFGKDVCDFMEVISALGNGLLFTQGTRVTGLGSHRCPLESVDDEPGFDYFSPKFPLE